MNNTTTLRLVLIYALIVSMQSCGNLPFYNDGNGPYSTSELDATVIEAQISLVNCQYFEDVAPKQHQRMTMLVPYPYFNDLGDEEFCAKAMVGGNMIVFNTRTVDNPNCPMFEIAQHELLHNVGLEHSNVFYNILEECR